MAKKCSIPGCRSNYDPPKNSFSVSKAHVKVFRLPKSTSELELWLHSIPFKNLNLHKDLVVCVKHWPADFKTVSLRGKERPRYPPSVWEGIPQSCIPLPPPPPRKTHRSSLTVRDAQLDEMEAFQELDKVDHRKIIR